MERRTDKATLERQSPSTLDRLTANAERGYLDDRLEDGYLPNSLFGPPTPAELEVAESQMAPRPQTPARVQARRRRSPVRPRL